MGVAGELESGGDEDGIDFDARDTGELKVELGGLVSLSGAGEDPSAAGEQCSGEDADEAFGLVGAEGGQAECPGLAVRAHALRDSVFFDVVGHVELLGRRQGKD